MGFSSEDVVYFREIVETMVQAYSQRIFNNNRPVYDGRRNLYTKDPLPIGTDKVGASLHP